MLKKELQEKYDAVLVNNEILKEMVTDYELEIKELKHTNDEYKKYVAQLEKNYALAKSTLDNKDKEIEELKNTIKELNEPVVAKDDECICEYCGMNECDNPDCKECSMTNEEYEEYKKQLEKQRHFNILDNELEDSAIEEAKKQAKEEEELTMTDKEMGYFKTTIEAILKFKREAIDAIMYAPYEYVADQVVTSGKEALKVAVLQKKGKSLEDELNAFDKVRKYVNDKKALMETSDKAPSFLIKLGFLIKSIIAKILGMLLATGRIVGDTFITISALVTRVTVGAIVETVELGKSAFRVASEEYAKLTNK